MTTETNFVTARGRIASKIKKLETELAYWHDELKVFDRVETTMKRLNSEPNGESRPFKLESATDRPIEPKAALEKRNAIINDFASKPKQRGEIRDLVLGAVNSTKEFLTTKEVERSLLRVGFQPKGKHFSVTVFKTLNRLAGKGKIASKREGGHVWFKSL